MSSVTRHSYPTRLSPGKRVGSALRSMCEEGRHRWDGRMTTTDSSTPTRPCRHRPRAHQGVRRRAPSSIASTSTCHAGEVLGLIGANGAGKTTTVECLQGLRRPDAGELRVLGLDPFHDADRLRPQIGSQLQSSGLPDRLRVGEAVALFAGPHATDAGALLEQFGLADKRRSPYAGLSGGERQRLFLVLALLNRPRLVILDELTQGLDPAARREVWSAVAQLRDAGTTVLLVTHELDEAEALCERVVAMRDGRVMDQGTPAELVARHAREVTVRFAMADADLHATADALQSLNRLPGVAGVTRDRGQVAVRGDRRRSPTSAPGWSGPGGRSRPTCASTYPTSSRLC